MKRASILLSLVIALLAWTTPLSAQFPPPGASWRTLETTHFRVHHLEANEEIARRAATRAETAHRQLRESFTTAPRGRIDLVVADYIDLPAGAASAFLNLILINTHPPVDTPDISFFDDWLTLVITHELVHIFHLHGAGGMWKLARGALGGFPFLFPQVWSTPEWLSEGLATFYESRLTEAGRLRGTHYDMILRTAALEDALFTLDRVTGEPESWPRGATSYAYGSRFIAHLADRHGLDRVNALVEQVGRQVVPYRLDAAAKRTLGTSLPRAWREWSDSLTLHYRAVADSLGTLGLTDPEILTTGGGHAAFPRHSPSGEVIAFAAATGREQRATRLITPDGRERHLAARNGTGPTTWLPDGSGVLLSQAEHTDPHRILADLYRVEVGGRQVRLTQGARLLEPDLHADGRRLVAVRSAPATNSLVILDLETKELRELHSPSPDVHWSAPRWSPTGERIAVSRWQAGGRYDVVVLDAAGSLLREITGDRAEDRTPTWSPDGRYVLFSSDRTGVANLYAYDLEEETLFQVTNVLTGAFQPDVSPDGRWIAFSYYRANGYHIARIPFDPSSWRPAPPARGTLVALPAAAPAPLAETGPSRPYSAWRFAAPRFWLPIAGYEPGLGWTGGASLMGMDAVGRHSYFAEARAFTSGQLDASLDYTFSGLGTPEVILSARQEWLGDRVTLVRAGMPDTLRGTRLTRYRTASVGLELLRPRIRSTASLTLKADARQVEFRWAEEEGVRPATPLPQVPLDLGVSLAGSYSNAQRYPFSISPEDGNELAASVQARRYLAGASGDLAGAGYLRTIGGGTLFQALDLPGFSRHTLALSLHAGAEVGARSPGIWLGGIDGRLGLALRGYENGVQVGDRALRASAQYHFPIALVERGAATLPFFADRLAGLLFLDAGSAWCSGECRRLDAPAHAPVLLASAGTELITALRLGYRFPVSVRSGVAVPLIAPPNGGEQRARGYLRLQWDL